MREAEQDMSTRLSQPVMARPAFQTSQNFSPQMVDYPHGKPPTLKPQTSNSSFKKRFTINGSTKNSKDALKLTLRDNETDYDDMLAESGHNRQNSIISYKSITSRMFPKVQMSQNHQNKILQSLPRRQRQISNHNTIDTDALLQNSSRTHLKRNINTLSPIPNQNQHTKE